ncbi:MAG: hypothetical protein J1E01_04275 [Acetatifactor sp.]|nr:hypothetical protein [Acetatifactor sp.]
MKRGIKSYLAFTSGFYRWILFVLAPLAAVGFQAVLAIIARRGGHTTGEELSEFWMLETILMFGSSMVLMMAEILLDGRAFGGIAVKRGSSLDCIKASSRGRELMRTALRMDMIRMFLESAAVVLLGRTAWTFFGGVAGLWDLWGICVVSAAVVCQYFVTVTALLIVRHFDYLGITVCAACFAYQILGVFAVLTTMNCYVMMAVFTVLSVAVSFFSQWKIMRRVEESFYDK